MCKSFALASSSYVSSGRSKVKHQGSKWESSGGHGEQWPWHPSPQKEAGIATVKKVLHDCFQSHGRFERSGCTHLGSKFFSLIDVMLCLQPLLRHRLHENLFTHQDMLKAGMWKHAGVHTWDGALLLSPVWPSTCHVSLQGRLRQNTVTLIDVLKACLEETRGNAHGVQIVVNPFRAALFKPSPVLLSTRKVAEVRALAQVSTFK